MSSQKPYRPNVGIALFNAEGRVLIARRFRDDGPEIILPGLEWQMPQGGIDAGEDTQRAAIRELAEETAVTSAHVIAESPRWYNYDLPEHLIGKSWGGKYRGQTQKWFALRFDGEDSEINLAPPGHKQEFDQWRWANMGDIIDIIVPFKRPVYERVIADFRHLGA